MRNQYRIFFLYSISIAFALYTPTASSQLSFLGPLDPGNLIESGCRLVGGRCPPPAIDPCNIVGNICDEIVNVPGAVIKTVTDASGNVVKTVETAAGDVIKNAEKGVNDVSTTFTKAGSDIEANYSKAWSDTTEQTKRSFDDTVDAAKAGLRYTERTAKGQLDSISNANRRLREGKAVDAIWGLAVEPLQTQEENLFKATQESSLINQAGASAAAIYGGPGGAAAYAAWQTYKTTGDASLALRAGVIAGFTSQVSGSAGVNAQNATFIETLRRSALAGAAGGVAVASQGGDEAAIRDGFLKSSGAVLIQYGKDSAKAYSPKLADGIQLTECISAKDWDCVSGNQIAKDAAGKWLKDSHGKPVEWPQKIDIKTEIGKWSGIDLKAQEAKAKKTIADISKLPQSNIVVLGKSRWVMTTTLGVDPTITYGQPTVVLTSLGDEAPFKFDRRIGRVQTGVKGGNYVCRGGYAISIKTVRKGNGCISTYFRKGTPPSETLWESVHNPNICIDKVKEKILLELNPDGITCNAE